MEYNHEEIDGIIVLSMSGDLIGENSGPELVQLANDAIHKGIKLCVVDLSEVRYMNSSGIGVLITLLTKYRNQEGEMILIKPSGNIQKLLLITKLNKIFTIVNTKDEAIEILSNQK
jgi:anti-sigma B factor antagonist